MNISVISLTENGRHISLKIAECLKNHKVVRYCFYKHSDENSETFIKLSKLAESIFDSSEAIIFICACGIAVRITAPHICSKLNDPAVIVIDDCGKYVIPILSGHIGGANALAKHLANVINMQAIITTATDIGGYFSPDSFAAANNLIVVSDYTIAKHIASTVLEGEKIGLISEYKCLNIPKDIVCNERQRYTIYIGQDNIIKPFSNTFNLVPKNIAIGIGCKKGVCSEAIESAVRAAFKNKNIMFDRICGAATIDLKKDENGLVEFCKKHDIKLNFYSAQELMNVKGNFSSSEFVMGITGADNVCERSAVKLSGGKIIVRKYAYNGVTVAAAEIPVIIDFEREML